MSRKVVETNTDRSATYDFLLVFHTNYSHISYQKGDICEIFPALVFNAPSDGFLVKFCSSDEARKN